MSPSFAVRERDFPAFTLSHMTLPPLDARLTLSENDRERTVMLSFVVLAEREEGRVFVRGSGGRLRAGRGIAPVCGLYELYGRRRAESAAARQIFMRRLCRRGARKGTREADGYCKKRLRRRARVCVAADRAFRHIAVELSGTDPDSLKKSRRAEEPAVCVGRIYSNEK